MAPVFCNRKGMWKEGKSCTELGFRFWRWFFLYNCFTWGWKIAHSPAFGMVLLQGLQIYLVSDLIETPFKLKREELGTAIPNEFIQTDNLSVYTQWQRNLIASFTIYDCELCIEIIWRGFDMILHSVMCLISLLPAEMLLQVIQYLQLCSDCHICVT